MGDMRDLREHVQGAIDEYLAQEGGGFVTSWYFVAEFVDSDGDESWLYATADGQRLMTTLGLLAWARGVAEFEQQCYLEEVGDE